MCCQIGNSYYRFTFFIISVISLKTIFSHQRFFRKTTWWKCNVAYIFFFSNIVDLLLNKNQVSKIIFESTSTKYYICLIFLKAPVTVLKSNVLFTWKILQTKALGRTQYSVGTQVRKVSLKIAEYSIVF